MKIGEWTLRSRRVVTPSGIRAADVVIRKEQIAAVSDYDGPQSEGVIFDVGDLVVLPGLVALHLDGPVRSDGTTYEFATKDAGAGGVTTLIHLPPDHDPKANAPSGMRYRLTAAEGNIRVDCGLVAGLSHGNVELIQSSIESGAIGVEAFLGSSHPPSSRESSEAELRAVMPVLARLDRPLLVHSARLNRSSARTGESDRFGDALPDREFEALRLLIRLCRESRCQVHLIHPTATEALPMIAQARAEGLPLTVETCPYHLSFSAEAIVDGTPTYALNPKSQGPDGRARLWEGLRTGLIDSVGSDHPQAFAIPEKGTPGEVRLARRQFSSLRYAVSAVWTEAKLQGFTPGDLARWMAGKTARAFGLATRKGSIAVGLDADFAVFDPDAKFVADPDPHHRRHAFPPLDGRTLTGRVEATILRGSLIYQGDRFLEEPKGTVVLRLEDTLPMHGTIA
jgi:allantoinase